jgi:hypothetical protein
MPSIIDDPIIFHHRMLEVSAMIDYLMLEKFCPVLLQLRRRRHPGSRLLLHVWLPWVQPLGLSLPQVDDSAADIQVPPPGINSLHTPGF